MRCRSRQSRGPDGQSQVLLLLATASLETGQPRTTLNCIDRLRGEAKAAGPAEDDMDVDGGDTAAATDRTTGAFVLNVPR